MGAETTDQLSTFKSTSGVLKGGGQPKQQRQHFACDRCRGQKLRCIRIPNQEPSCERCQKVGATCVVNPLIRMGRPQRADKERRGTASSSASSRESQYANSADSAVAGSSSHSASKSLDAENDHAWLRQDLGSHGDDRFSEMVDFGLNTNGLYDDALLTSASEDQYENGFDYFSPRLPGSMMTFSMDDLGIDESRDPSQPRSPFVSLGQLPAIDVPPATQRTMPRGNDLAALPPMPDEVLQKISSLNLYLHQQSNVASRIAAEYENSKPKLGEAPPDTNGLRCAIDTMNQGLQTFHALLLEILGSADQIMALSSSSRHASIDDTSNDRTGSQQTLPGPISMFCVGNLLGFGTAKDHNDAARSASSSRKSAHQTPRLGSLSGAPPQPQNHLTSIDMPTSLMIISCYINLVQLCRHVFRAIRVALSPPGQQKTLLALSSLQIGGVPIYQDPDLQIIILTQVVDRLINRIGLLLGIPGTGTGSPEWRDDNVPCAKPLLDSMPCAKPLLPQLLKVLLRQEGIWGQASAAGGIEALREEIKKLNEEVVGKTT